MEYPSVLLNHQLNPEIFSKESLQAYFEKEGWRFYMLDIRELSDQEIALGHILPILPSYVQYYVRYWNNGKLSMIVKCLANLPVGIQTFYDENGNISEQVDYSKKFGRVSPQDVLSILEREKVISLSEETSRRASSEGFEFSFNLNYDEKTKIWLADINLDFKKGIAEETFNSSRKFVHYKIDGQTGRILDISYDEVDFW